MSEKLTNALVAKTESKGKRYDIRDAVFNKLLLRVEPSGKKTWYVDYTRANGRRNTKKLGDADVLKVAEARELAREYLAMVSKGEEPRKNDVFTLGDLVEKEYAPWVTAHRKSASFTLQTLRNFFTFIWKDNIEDISLGKVEKWRLAQKKKGVKSATINRRITALRAVLNWGKRRGLISRNPIDLLERLRETDSPDRVRFLSPEERASLMAVLEESHPLHRGAVIVSLNTGIRQGALFDLRWTDIDFSTGTITLRAESAKAEKEQKLPMNGIVRETLSSLPRLGKHIFPHTRTGEPVPNYRTAWETILKHAEIDDFRWHDMRHDFASRLVMAGVDLNTVRELLGHADLTMTLRYAHLAPDVKKRAVDLLE